MFYTPEQRADIESVKSLFDAYIRESNHFDLLLSNKIGYLFMKLDLARRDVPEGPTVIESGEELTEVVFDEIILDVMDTHNAQDLDETSIKECWALLGPYIAKRPDLRPVAEREIKIYAGQD